MQNAQKIANTPRCFLGISSSMTKNCQIMIKHITKKMSDNLWMIPDRITFPGKPGNVRSVMYQELLGHISLGAVIVDHGPFAVIIFHIIYDGPCWEKSKLAAGSGWLRADI